MRLPLKIVLPIFLGLFLGIGLVLLHISSNGTLQKYIVQKVQKDFAQHYQCRLECQLDQIDWLSLRMHFSHVSMKPLSSLRQESQENWSIIADTFVLSASWWSLVVGFHAKICGAFEHMIMYEKLDQSEQSKLMNFLTKLFKRGQGGFVVYDWMSINDGLLFIEQNDGVCVRMPYACNVSCERMGTRMQFYPQGGKIFVQDSLVLDEIFGTFVWDIPGQDIIKGMSAQINIGVRIPLLMGKDNCSLIGTIKQGQGIFMLKNEDDSFVIDPIQIRVDSNKCLFDLSILANSNICKQFALYEFAQDVCGQVRVDCRGDLYDLLNSLQVDIALNNLLYKSKKLIQDVTASVYYIKPGVLSGLFSVENKQFCEFTITIGQDSVKATCVSNRDFIMPGDSYWKIPAQQFVADMAYDKQDGWKGSYNIECRNDKLHKQKKISGTCAIKEQKLLLLGNLDDISYDIAVQLAPILLLERAQFVQNGKKLIDLSVDENNRSVLLGNIDFACVQYVVSDAFKASFSQDGAIQFRGCLQDGVYHGQVETKQANIRIPRIYNVIQNVTASCELDFYNRMISLKDVKAELHEGEIICSGANLFFDKAGKCQFMHVPCLLHNVLMSWDKGIFMLLSGGMLLHKVQDESMCVSGQIIIEKSQLKENLFSSEFQETLFGKVLEYDDKDSSENNCNIDVAICTKDFLHVKTSFLAAHAKLDLLLKGSIKKPELSGLIQLVSGSFYFPYKSLEITDGKLFFLPDQQFDPLIDVVAKGKLKRFGVSMHVTGSVFDPVVQFDSTPYLTEEQIVSLLLLGIEESSLGVMVPALLTQKLKDLIFGPALSKAKMQSKFERLLQSLKYFRFLPQFTNQTGRGGIRGVFEVEASDHLHGRIDTNFMQLEDTKFDADFALTDDITIRAQKDGPSTYGGEVEFKWKFGK